MTSQEISAITDYIFIGSRLEPADLAFVFGTRLAEPIIKIKEVYDAGLVKRILISGGINRHTGRNEAQDMAAALIGLGVVAEHLILEDKSTNSLENVLFSRSVIEQVLGWADIKRIAVICKHYHSRRALMTLKKHFLDRVELFAITYDVLGFNRNDWSVSEVGREKVLAEWEKIPRYLARGDIAEL
ncbi:YdcF family protein [Patescibacteria group bacterium]|nr:YdcF family protein [Patescibacteria group bacterium]MBU1029063.1 YdcF family protein [Patescibacteria group bacterium]MBU1915630.1 YdcF family protein [Patescibacteria group bacterium]